MSLVDQPLPTTEDSGRALQLAANKLTAAVSRQIESNKGINFVDNEVTLRLMFVHVQALTQLLVEKGVLDEVSVQKALTDAFANTAAAMTKPTIVLPSH